MSPSEFAKKIEYLDAVGATASHKAAVRNIYNALHERLTAFRYEKSNGEIRLAIGTLNADIAMDYGFEETFKKEKEEEKRTSINNNSIMRYYDIEKRAFRSFKLMNLISENDEYEI